MPGLSQIGNVYSCYFLADFLTVPILQLNTLRLREFKELRLPKKVQDARPVTSPRTFMIGLQRQLSLWTSPHPCAPIPMHAHIHKSQDLGLVKVQNSSISSCFNGRVSHGWSDLQRKFPLWALLACFPSILLSSGLPEERTLTSPRDGFPPPEASMGHFKYRQRPCGPGWVS